MFIHTVTASPYNPIKLRGASEVVYFSFCIWGKANRERAFPSAGKGALRSPRGLLVRPLPTLASPHLFLRITLHAG